MNLSILIVIAMLFVYIVECTHSESFKTTLLFGSEILDCGANMTCGGRCDEQFKSTAPCQCDRACVDYRDCCYDYQQMCLSEARRPLAMPLTRVSASVFSCATIQYFNLRRYLIVNTCPKGTKRELAESCEYSHANPLTDPTALLIPVTLLSNTHQYGRTYANIYCAQCHGESKEALIRWSVGYRCDIARYQEKSGEYQSIFHQPIVKHIRQLPELLPFCEFGVYLGKQLEDAGLAMRECPVRDDVVSTCPPLPTGTSSSREHEMRSNACHYYQYLVEAQLRGKAVAVTSDRGKEFKLTTPSNRSLVVYKNYHCALCNGGISSADDELNQACGLSIDNNKNVVQGGGVDVHFVPSKKDFDLVIDTNKAKVLLEFPRSESIINSDIACGYSEYFSPPVAGCRPITCPSTSSIRFQQECLQPASSFICAYNTHRYPAGSYKINSNRSLTLITKPQANKASLSYYDTTHFLQSALREFSSVAIDEKDLSLYICSNRTAPPPSDTMWNQPEKTELNFIFEYVLTLTCVLSIFTTCLGLLFLLLVKATTIYTSLAFQILLTSLLSLIVSIPRLLLGDEMIVCTLAAMMDQYMWIVFYAWLCALTYEQMQGQKLDPSALKKRAHFYLYLVVCWLCPLVIVGINAAMHFIDMTWLNDIYGKRYCSVANVGIYLFSTILPTASLLIVSIFFLVGALYRYQPIRTVFSPKTVEFHKEWLFRSLILLFIAGITWCLNLLYNVLQIDGAFYFAIFFQQLQSGVYGIMIFAYSQKEIHRNGEAQAATSAQRYSSISRTLSKNGSETMKLGTYASSGHLLQGTLGKPDCFGASNEHRFHFTADKTSGSDGDILGTSRCPKTLSWAPRGYQTQHSFPGRPMPPFIMRYPTGSKTPQTMPRNAPLSTGYNTLAMSEATSRKQYPYMLCRYGSDDDLHYNECSGNDSRDSASHQKSMFTGTLCRGGGGTMGGGFPLGKLSARGTTSGGGSDGERRVGSPNYFQAGNDYGSSRNGGSEVASEHNTGCSEDQDDIVTSNNSGTAMETSLNERHYTTSSSLEEGLDDCGTLAVCRPSGVRQGGPLPPPSLPPRPLRSPEEGEERRLTPNEGGRCEDIEADCCQESTGLIVDLSGRNGP